LCDYWTGHLQNNMSPEESLSKKLKVYASKQGNDGGSSHVWNVGLHQQDYTMLYPESLSSSYISPWESEISHYLF
jgi:hypothetical protein